MLKFLRKRRVILPVSCLLNALVLLYSFMPLTSFALTSGPSQPEMSGFTPAGETQLVDPFTGDFSYNIPLMEVDGYPLNIAYRAGAGMEEEAGWVGLGWSLGVGQIARTLRGVPDDFNGADEITKELNIRPNRTVGISFKPDLEVFGAFSLGSLNVGSIKLENLGLSYNNYSGLGFESGLSAELSSVRRNRFYSRKIEFALNSKKNIKTISFPNTRLSKYAQYASLLFSDPTTIPSVDLSMHSSNITFDVKMGTEVTPAIFANAEITGYYAEQKLKEKSVSNPAYGYYYLHNHRNESDLLDYNRTDDKPYIKNMPFFSGSQLTYDQFSFSGQGMNGSFRLHRSDIGQVHDPAVTSSDLGLEFGFEPGIGTGFHFGFNPGGSYSFSKSGKWNYRNQSLDNSLQFSPAIVSDPGYEPAYFLIDGENTPLQEGLPDYVTNDQPFKISLGKASEQFSASQLIHTQGSTTPLLSRVKASSRHLRNRSIHCLTAGEAAIAGLEKNLRTYPLNDWFNDANILNYGTISRTAGFRKPEHFSEFTAINESGSRYVYGIPAYNTYSEEVTFNTAGNTQLAGKLVSYSDEDASTSNMKGMDRYYSKTKTPAYAHSYLLTAILSPDYTDMTGDGPSTDDAGDYVKFNYSRVYSNFGWRTPMANGMSNYAAFNPQLESLGHDDKGTYVYGLKEIWYLHSIETGNYVAIFNVSARRDGLGVTGPSGVIDTGQPLMKLDRVTLYTRNELDRYREEAIPLKTVSFSYDYSLCPGVSNNSGAPEYVNGANINQAGGKLTLKKISIRDGVSNRGALSPYTFEYGFNPTYNRLANDRWGNYTPATSAPDNTEYPYTLQTKSNQDVYASAWNMNAVNLPSGGRLEVEYESDDYAYVQNKPAARMFKIAGVGWDTDYHSGSILTGGHVNRLHVYVRLDEALDHNGQFTAKYVKGLKYLYFNNHMDITGKDDFEYIHGYARIKDSGLCDDDNNYGWIELDYMPSGDAQTLSKPFINPFSWYALKFARENLQEKIFPMTNLNFDDDKAKLGRSLVSVVTDFLSLAIGMNASLLGMGFCKKLDKTKSWIRLYDPDGRKFGGGHRVKSIRRYDEWKALSGSNTNAYYGQEYGYTCPGEDGKKEISSGVASYEPLIGGDENSLHKPVFYEHRSGLFTNTESYLEWPYTEACFPAPVVGYSKVTVKNTDRAGVSSHATGHTEYRFFTSRSYPTEIQRTELEKKGLPANLTKAGSMLYNKVAANKVGVDVDISSTFLSQGFSVSVNDMHGKQKSVFHYSEFDDKIPVSGVEYAYFPLGKKVSTVNRQGNTGTDLLGSDVDVFLDSRYQFLIGGSLTIKLNVDFYLLGIVPAITPTGHAGFSYLQNEFASSSVTKVIRYRGLIRSVKTWDMGSGVEVRNVSFDRETGRPVVTETVNEFNDPEYQTALPAYWVFPYMGPACRNIKSSGSLQITAGVAPMGVNRLVPGDELLAYHYDAPPLIQSNLTDPELLWVTGKAGSSLDIRTRNGDIPEDGTYIYTVTRSGYRNNLSADAATGLSLKNPVRTGAYLVSDSMITATATTYSDERDPACHLILWNQCPESGCERDTPCIDNGYLTNKYSYGLAGNWRRHEEYAFNAVRNYQTPNGANTTDARYDGLYAQYTPYWICSGGTWSSPFSPDWVRMREATAYSPEGNELENRNALGIYSSALFGYGGTQSVAVAGNARYREIFYDNMEEYGIRRRYEGCRPRYRDLLADLAQVGCLNGNVDTLDFTDAGIPGFPDDLIDGDFSIPVLPDSAEIENAQCRPLGWLTRNAHTGLYSYVAPSAADFFKLPVDSNDACLNHFTLYPGKDYIFSVWIREPGAAPGALKYQSQVSLLPVPGNHGPQLLSTSGLVIEGWQKIEGVFRAPAGSEWVLFGFVAPNNLPVLVDDIRIFPADGSIRTFAYNPYSLQLMAQLDDNNYASIYEYGRENELRRIKAETERGMETVRELMANVHKTPPPPPFIHTPPVQLDPDIWPEKFFGP